MSVPKETSTPPGDNIDQNNPEAAANSPLAEHKEEVQKDKVQVENVQIEEKRPTPVVFGDISQRKRRIVLDERDPNPDENKETEELKLQAVNTLLNFRNTAASDFEIPEEAMQDVEIQALLAEDLKLNKPK